MSLRRFIFVFCVFFLVTFSAIAGPSTRYAPKKTAVWIVLSGQNVCRVNLPKYSALAGRIVNTMSCYQCDTCDPVRPAVRFYSADINLYMPRPQ